MQEDFLNILDNLSKTRAEKKKEEYLRKLKEKKQEKRKNKKKSKIDENYNQNQNHSDDLESHKLAQYDGKIQNSQKENLEKKHQDQEEIQKMMQEENIEIEYVDEDPLSKPKMYDNFKNVFEYFVIPKKEKKEKYSDDEEEEGDFNEEDYYLDDLDGVPLQGDKQDISTSRLSKKKRKLLSRMKISELKALTDYPEVVEAWDVTAQDPIFLIRLKSMKNTVAVPKHWANRRKFLANKRGVLKQPFRLPDFIEATGISKIRDNSATDKKSLKQKSRERMQPKLGRMDIDYQVLHDAFFRYQTKPNLSIQGDIYYEGREHENKMKIFKPGRISEKLRVALGIPENTPPPWIINMQRYGPPPSYSNLKIPGINAPLLDPTAEITPNLWTPPVNEDKAVLVYDFNRKSDIEHWGDLREVEEDQMSEDLNEDMSIEEEERERPNVDNLFSGMDMNLSGETKTKINYSAISEGGNTSTANVSINQESILQGAVPNPNANIIYPTMTASEKSFYTVLEQKSANISKGEIYGSSFKYVIPGQEENISGTKEIKEGDAEKEKEKIQKEENKINETSKSNITQPATTASTATAKQKTTTKKAQPSFKF
jgi:splicing factor 3B subunit 2